MSCHFAEVGTGNYQAETVCWVGPNEVNDVTVQHELGDHRALPGVNVDLRRDKAKDIWVRDVLPENGLFAEMLRSSYIRQRKKKGGSVNLTFWI